MLRPALFEPIRIGAVELANRIVVGPVCQYSAQDGCMSDWHLIHLGQLALSGAGLLVIETTAVLPEGRISHADVGLWNDKSQAAMSLTLESLRRWSDVAIAIELSHAGSKASVEVPWKGGMQFAPGQALGWQTQAPSAVACGPGRSAPRAIDRLDLERIREGFASAATRASRLGIEVVQINAADGYLLHQFLSPSCNSRGDEYGGSPENRMRFPIEVFQSVRDAYGASGAVVVRIPDSDGTERGWDVEQSLVFARALQSRGCDAIHIGSIWPGRGVPTHADQQPGLARMLKRAPCIPVAIAGTGVTYQQAEAIVASGHADLVVLTGTILHDPRWPWRAAQALGAGDSVRLPVQYRLA